MAVNHDDGADDMNATEYKYALRDRLMAEADPRDDTEAAFLERALEETVKVLASNYQEHDAGGISLGSPNVKAYKAVSELLDDNVRDVDVRANGQYAAPKVTVWLREHPPIWANTATQERFNFSSRREHYNGDPTLAILDVRPF